MRDIKDYMRVTDILYPFSGYGSIDPVILQNACDRGTKVHQICDAMISGMGIGQIEESLKGYIQSFNYYLNCPVERNFIRNSHRFFDDKLKITGECDAIYESEEGFTLVDFKTSAKEGKTWEYQGAAYEYLARENGITITNIEFVMLDKRGMMPEIKRYKDSDSSLKVFMQCYNMYKLFFKNKQEIGEYL